MFLKTFNNHTVPREELSSLSVGVGDELSVGDGNDVVSDVRHGDESVHNYKLPKLVSCSLIIVCHYF